MGTAGTTSGLILSDLSDDSWSFNIPPDTLFEVTMILDNSLGDLELTLWDFSSGYYFTGALDSAGSISDREIVTYLNDTGSTIDAHLLVWIYSGTCNTYDLEVQMLTNPCLTSTDDGEENNDARRMAVVPSANSLPGLFVSRSDQD